MDANPRSIEAHANALRFDGQAPRQRGFSTYHWSGLSHPRTKLHHSRFERKLPRGEKNRVVARVPLYFDLAKLKTQSDAALKTTLED